MKALTSWPHIFLGIIGAGTSAYAVYAHRLAMAGGDACGFEETWNCNEVLKSKWGEIFGIPLGFFGLLFFAIVIIMAIATRDTKATPQQFALQNLLVAAVGFASSLALTYISIYIIHYKCKICLYTHSVTFSLFLVSLWQFFRARRMGKVEPADSPQK